MLEYNTVLQLYIAISFITISLVAIMFITKKNYYLPLRIFLPLSTIVILLLLPLKVSADISSSLPVDIALYRYKGTELLLACFLFQVVLCLVLAFFYTKQILWIAIIAILTFLCIVFPFGGFSTVPGKLYADYNDFRQELSHKFPIPDYIPDDYTIDTLFGWFNNLGLFRKFIGSNSHYSNINIYNIYLSNQNSKEEDCDKFLELWAREYSKDTWERITNSYELLDFYKDIFITPINQDISIYINSDLHHLDEQERLIIQTSFLYEDLCFTLQLTINNSATKAYNIENIDKEILEMENIIISLFN